MSDDFQEIEHEVRRDRLVALARRYWKYGAAVALVAIGAAVAVVVLGQQGEAARLKDAAAFRAALAEVEIGQDDKAAEAFHALAESSDSGYAVLSRLREAQLLAKAGQRVEAARVYDALAADSSTDPAYRDLARVLAAQLLVDSAPAAEIETRLKDLAEAGPWRALARELMALAYYRAGDRAAARQLIEELADDPRVSASARARIREMLEILGGSAPS